MKLLNLKTSCSLAILSIAAFTNPNTAHAACTPNFGLNGNDNILCTGLTLPGAELDTLNGNDSITNTGNVQASFGAGFAVFDLNLGTFSFNNSGPITALDANTIVVNTNGPGVFTNSSTIQNNSSGRVFQADIIGNQSGGTVTINNQVGGNLSIASAGVSDSAINITGQGGSSLGTLAITNAGTITAGNQAIIITSPLNLTTTNINNSGTINAGTDAILNQTNSNDTVTNSGTIMGEISLGGGTDVLTNTNSITGDINAATGSNTYNLNAGTITGNILSSTGTDTVSLGGGNITGNITDSDLVNGVSTLLVNADTTIAGNISVVNTRLNAGHTLTTSNLNTTNLIVEITDPTTTGFLSNTSGAIDLTGINLSADISALVLEDDEVQIGSGTAQVIGFSGGAGQSFVDIADNSVLFDFGVADGSDPNVTTSTDNTSLFVVVNKIDKIRDLVEQGNEKNIGDVFDSVETLPIGSSPELQSIFSNLIAASSVEELSAVLQATIPSVDGGSFSAAQNITGNTIRLVTDRLTVIRDHSGSATQTGISSGDLTENLQMWGQFFGQSIDQGEREGIAGFDATTRGLTFGVDTEVIADEATVGLAFSYANTDVASRSVNNTRSEIDSYNISLYGDYDLDDTTYLVGDIGYTYGDNESTRFNVGGVSGLNADSDYGSHQLELRVIGAKDHYVDYRGEGFRVTPKLQAHYIRFQNEEFTETGAGGANLNIDSEALDILEFGVGVDVRKDFKQEDGSTIETEVSVGYRYDVIGEPLQTTSTFSAGGPSFRSEGADPDQDTLNLGFDVGYTTTTSLEFTAGYDFEVKDEFKSHSAFLRAAVPF